MRLRRTALPALLIAFASLLGCKSDSARLTAVEDPIGYRLEVAWKPLELRLIGPDGSVVTEIRPGGIGIGRVAAFSADQNYDPNIMVFDLLNGPHEPPGLTWASVERATGVTEDTSGAHFEVTLSDDTTATLHVSTLAAGRFRLELEVPGAGLELEGEPEVVYTWYDFHAPPDEEFYGLGQVFHSVAHRGKTIAMQMGVRENESFNNEAHVRIPLLISSGSWGVFANSMRPAYVDVAETDPETVRFLFNDPALEINLLAGPEPLTITEHYVALTAQPAIPPVWAFAPLQWRNEIDGQAEVLQDASEIRQNGVPTGAIWIDRPYQSGFNTMDFDPVRYPDPPAMVDELHAKGFRLAGWNTPYLEDSDPDYPMAEQNGWFAEGTFVFFNFGRLLDLTHPDAMANWQGRVTAALARGIEGWKLDYGEDIQIGVSDLRLHFSFYSGEDERTMNRRYAEYYHRAYAEPLGLPEVFILARAGTIGGQAYASVIWPGDLDSDFSDFGDIDADNVVHVGGLPSAVRAGTGLSVSGYPFFASDTGGFRHSRPTHEVMCRWTQYSALLPIMQYGGGGNNHNPWDFTDYGDSVFTQETLDIFNRYASLHIRLFPYFYTYSRQAHETGRPVARPFGLSYPSDGRHPDDVFLSGPDLLVAPLMYGGTQRDVPLPEGRWIDWWTGEAIDGPVDLPVTVPLDTMPLYLRAGAIVPMLRPTVMTLSPVTDLTVDSYDTDPGRLWGRFVPALGEQTSLTLHDGTGIELEGLGDGTVSLNIARGSAYDGLRVQVYAPDAQSIERDGSALTAAADLTELDSCSGCYFREGTEPWIWVAVAPGTTGPVNLVLG